MSVSVNASNLDGVLQVFESFPQQAAVALSRSINQVMDRTALELARKEIMAQTAFPEGYLDDPSRLGVTQYATPTRLEGKITGRDRATSLARFIVGTPVRGQPVTVQVNPGDLKRVATGFVVQLRSGNLGLAIRLRPGEPMPGRTAGYNAGAELRPDVFLTYAPSVDQVFRDVAQEIEKPVGDALEVEFTRQMAVLLRLGQDNA